MTNPAQNLAGHDLGNGWKVVKKYVVGYKATGGHFSVGYLVQNDQGTQAYMKALDFSAAFQTSDISRTLEEMTKAYNFERDLLNKCKTCRMSRVVTPILDGVLNVGGIGPNNTVCYLIFNLAEGDIRKHKHKLIQFDLAWCLRSMHNTAVGLSQLHYVGIAHQDLKPSNVLVFAKDDARVTDLGRASDVEKPFIYDELQCPGDIGYAPPEQIYGYIFINDFERKKAADMYLFGSLFFFFFCDVSAIQATEAALKRQIGMNHSNTDFEADLPYIRRAFNECLEELYTAVKPMAGELTSEIVKITSELCEPDPRRRGDTKKIPTVMSQYSFERYISRLDLLAKKAEYGMVN